MLDDTDTAVVSKWLKLALADDDTKGKRAALANHCGVTPQAVSGWLRTGRITKTNLERAAAFFGHGPSFGAAANIAAERRATYTASSSPGELPAGLTSAERDLVLSFRTLPKRRRSALLDAIMKEAQQHLEDLQEAMARNNTTAPVSAERAAQTLPVRPDGEQPDTVPGPLD